MDELAIDVSGVTKRFGSKTVVNAIDLQVRRGEIFGFLGPNGAGKTTSVKLLAGLARATSGSGTLLGYTLGDKRARRKLGYLPELFRYPDWLSAREVLDFHARLTGDARASRDIPRVLDLVGLTPRANDRVATFSKGMQQRLGLATALLGEPDLVILDEPTSALDPAGRLEVRGILHDLKARGTSVFLNSHLLTEVERVCDRVAIVTGGRIVAKGSLAEILGTQHAVRIRARSNGTPLESILAPFGRVDMQDGTGAVLVHGVKDEDVPCVVDALVRASAEVFAVEPLTATLEQRFLELTRERGT